MPLTHVRTFRGHYECDAYGHVNQANYLRYMQEAAFDATAAAGYDLGRYEAKWSNTSASSPAGSAPERTEVGTGFLACPNGRNLPHKRGDVDLCPSEDQGIRFPLLA